MNEYEIVEGMNELKKGYIYKLRRDGKFIVMKEKEGQTYSGMNSLGIWVELFNEGEILFSHNRGKEYTVETIYLTKKQLKTISNLLK